MKSFKFVSLHLEWINVSLRMIEKDKYSVDLLGQLTAGDNWKYEIDDSFFKQIDGIIEK